MQIKAAIQNPTPGGSPFTGQHRAKRLVKSGRAKLLQKCPSTGAILLIAMVDFVVDLEEKKIAQRKRMELFQHERQDLSYDQIERLMQPEELSNIPMVGEIDKALQKTCSTSLGWAYSAGAGRKTSRPDDPERVAAARMLRPGMTMPRALER